MKCQGCSHISDFSYLCTVCMRKLYQTLTELALMWLQLQLTITRQAKTSVPQPGGKSTETPLVFDDNASEAAWVVRQTIESWVATVVLPQEIPVAGRFNWSPMEACVWLRERRERIALRDDAGQCVEELNVAVALSMKTVDHKPQRIYLGRCECGLEMYGYADGGEHECRCGRRHTISERRAENLKNARFLVCTADDAVDYLASVFGIRLRANRIQVWAARGKIDRLSRPGDTESVYRLGQILDQIRDTSPSHLTTK